MFSEEKVTAGLSPPHGSSLLSNGSAEKKKGSRSCDRDPLNL
jgi:hypothetical protein